MRVDKEFVLREIAGDYIIIPTGKTVLEFNGLITVNEVGVSIWNMLQKEVTFDKLVQGILDEYDVEEQVAREDIREFLDKLIAGGILKADHEDRDNEQDTVYLAAFSLEKQAIKDHSMILHSAYMCYEDTAVLFSAPSETGKSTQAGLWEKYRGTWTVNGDRSLLIREEDGWYANGWPVCGSSEICNNKSYPVRAIVMLSQAKENRISRLKGLEALRKVMEQITINAWNSEFQMQAMDELEVLLREIPVYHLECDISEDAVRCLENVLTDGRGEE